MDTDSSLLYVVIAVLIALSAIFSSAETAFMSTNRIRMRNLYEDGEKRAGLVLDMLEKGTTSSAVIMHGGAIMMLLAATAVPRHQPVEWTADNGRGYSLLITPSLYHKSGIVEVFDIV